MIPEEEYVAIINKMNATSLFQILTKTVLNLVFVYILFSFFGGITIVRFVHILFFMIGLNIFFHAISPAKIYHLKVALSYIIVSGFLIAIKIFYLS